MPMRTTDTLTSLFAPKSQNNFKIKIRLVLRK